MKTYIIGAELPDYELTWRDSAGAVIDFSDGWTFTVKLGIAGEAAELTKTTGITGAAAAPNIVVAWDPGQFDSLGPGGRDIQIFAHHTGGNKDRGMRARLRLDLPIL